MGGSSRRYVGAQRAASRQGRVNADPPAPSLRNGDGRRSTVSACALSGRHCLWRARTMVAMGVAGEDTPRKRMAAHALIRDDDGRVLLVEPTYADAWLLPGGAVEQDESPRAACAREIREELGLEPRVGALFVLEWVGPRPDLTEGLMFVYDGDVMSAGTELRLPPAELSSYRWAGPDDVAVLVDDELARRVAAALEAARAGTLIEMEDGVSVAQRRRPMGTYERRCRGQRGR